MFSLSLSLKHSYSNFSHSVDQGYEHTIQPVDQRAGVWLAGGLWSGPVRQPDPAVGRQRTDAPVRKATGL